ncbi:MAG: hypothetical protein M5U26_18105 [Planctomycetota bacterium]|nr:hypothetical protein [Planctomycetota bacterium]
MPLAFFTAVALFSAGWIVCAPKPGLGAMLGLGLGLGLAVLAKGHVPVAVVLLPSLAVALWRGGFNGRKVALYVSGLVLAAAAVAPWALIVHWRVPEAFDVMWREVSDAVEVASHDQNDRWVYYPYKLLDGLLPWTPVLALGWALSRRRRREEAAEHGARPPRLEDWLARFFFLTVVLGFVLFYAAPKQQYYYLLPLYPALALGAGQALARLNRPGGIHEERMAWFLIALGLAQGVAVALAPQWIGFLLYPLTIPLGVLTAVLYFVAARQWVEGNGAGVALSMGFAAYAVLIGLTMLGALDQRYRHPLARVADETAYALQHGYPEPPRLYAVRPGQPMEALLYYLDAKRIHGLDELLAESLDEQGHPRPNAEVAGGRTRIVICRAAVAKELGFEPPYPPVFLGLLPENEKMPWGKLKELGEVGG